MGLLYDFNKLTFFIMYVQADNFYGWAISQPLPNNKYESVSYDDCLAAFAELQNKAYSMWYDQLKHFIFAVDLDYPSKLHDRD